MPDSTRTAAPARGNRRVMGVGVPRCREQPAGHVLTAHGATVQIVGQLRDVSAQLVEMGLSRGRRVLCRRSSRRWQSAGLAVCCRRAGGERRCPVLVLLTVGSRPQLALHSGGVRVGLGFEFCSLELHSSSSQPGT